MHPLIVVIVFGSGGFNGGKERRGGLCDPNTWSVQERSLSLLCQAASGAFGGYLHVVGNRVGWILFWLGGGPSGFSSLYIY